MKPRTRRLLIVGLASLASASARADELAVVGTGDGIEMLRAVGAAFNARQGDVRIAVPASIGSGGAVAAVGGDKQQLGRVARPLSESEKAQGLVESPLVRIPSVIYAHPGVGVTSLTNEQLTGLFSGQIDNWKEVGGADMKVKVVRREESDSTLTVLRASMPGWKGLVLTPRSKTATTTQEAVEAVKRVPGAIGFGPYARELEDGAIVLAIDGRKPHDRDYPSAVTLSLIYKQAALDERGRAFAYAASEDVRKILSADGGIPLTR